MGVGVEVIWLGVVFDDELDGLRRQILVDGLLSMQMDIAKGNTDKEG